MEEVPFDDNDISKRYSRIDYISYQPQGSCVPDKFSCHLKDRFLHICFPQIQNQNKTYTKFISIKKLGYLKRETVVISQINIILQILIILKCLLDELSSTSHLSKN